MGAPSVSSFLRSLWGRVTGRGGKPPLKVRLNEAVIRDVAERLHPGSPDGVTEQNEASMAVSESTYAKIDELSRSVERDVEAARLRGKE